MDNYEDENNHSCVPIIKIGQSNFFFAVNKNRPDLLNELNFAMGKISDENRCYLKDFAPFCDSSTTGSLEGMLKNYLEIAANCAKNTTINFETKSYSTLQDALTALNNNEIDCVFPVHLSNHDAESFGIITTNPFIQTEMYLMKNKSSQKIISADEKIIVAVNGTNANYKTFLMDNYPNWQILDCNNLDAALEAVESSNADCALINNYQVAQLSSENYDLYALATGKEMNFSFAVKKSDSALYYILNKTSSLVPTAPLQSALTEFSSSGINFSFGEFLRRYFYAVIILFAWCTEHVYR